MPEREGEINREEEQEKSGFTKKVAGVFNNSEVTKQASKTFAGVAASIAGVKSFYDVPAYFKQRFSIGGMEGSVDRLTERIDKGDFEEEGPSKEREDLEKRLLSTKDARKKGSEARKIIAEVMRRERGKKSIKEKKDGETRETETTELLDRILKDHEEETRWNEEKKDALMKSLLDDYTEAKVTGMQASKEALNTALVGLDLVGLRGAMYGTMSIAERYERKKKEAKQKGEEMDVRKDVVIDGLKEFQKGITMKTEGGSKEKGLAFIKSAGSLLRFAGIGGTALSGFSNEKEALDNIIDNIGEKRFSEIGRDFRENILERVPFGAGVAHAGEEGAQEESAGFSSEQLKAEKTIESGEELNREISKIFGAETDNLRDTMTYLAEGVRKEEMTKQELITVIEAKLGFMMTEEHRQEFERKISKYIETYPIHDYGWQYSESDPVQRPHWHESSKKDLEDFMIKISNYYELQATEVPDVEETTDLEDARVEEKVTEEKIEEPEERYEGEVVSLSKGDNPWSVVEERLREELGRQPTDAEVIEVTKKVAESSDISVLEWGVEGSVNHEELPVGYELNFGGDVSETVERIKGDTVDDEAFVERKEVIRSGEELNREISKIFGTQTDNLHDTMTHIAEEVRKEEMTKQELIVILQERLSFTMTEDHRQEFEKKIDRYIETYPIHDYGWQYSESDPVQRPHWHESSKKDLEDFMIKISNYYELQATEAPDVEETTDLEDARVEEKVTGEKIEEPEERDEDAEKIAALKGEGFTEEEKSVLKECDDEEILSDPQKAREFVDIAKKYDVQDHEKVVKFINSFGEMEIEDDRKEELEKVFFADLQEMSDKDVEQSVNILLSKDSSSIDRVFDDISISRDSAGDVSLELKRSKFILSDTFHINIGSDGNISMEGPRDSTFSFSSDKYSFEERSFDSQALDSAYEKIKDYINTNKLEGSLVPDMEKVDVDDQFADDIRYIVGNTYRIDEDTIEMTLQKIDSTENGKEQFVKYLSEKGDMDKEDMKEAYLLLEKLLHSPREEDKELFSELLKELHEELQ